MSKYKIIKMKSQSNNYPSKILRSQNLQQNDLKAKDLIIFGNIYINKERIRLSKGSIITIT